MKKQLTIISAVLVLGGLTPAWGFTCSTDGSDPNYPVCPTSTPEIRLVGEQEPQETREFYEGGQRLIFKSIEITAPLYLLLMAMGTFKRYIRGRI